MRSLSGLRAPAILAKVDICKSRRDPVLGCNLENVEAFRTTETSANANCVEIWTTLFDTSPQRIRTIPCSKSPEADCLVIPNIYSTIEKFQARYWNSRLLVQRQAGVFDQV